MIYLLIFLTGFLSWSFSVLAAGGAGLIFIALSSFILPMSLVAPVLSIAGAIAGVHRCIIYRRYISWEISQWMIPGTVLGAFVGSYFFLIANQTFLELIVGFFLLITPLSYYKNLSLIRVPPRIEYFLPLSFLTSLVSATVGAAGPLTNGYYLKCRIPKNEIIGTKAFGILILQLVKTASYTSFSENYDTYVTLGIVAGGGGVVGNSVGKKLLIKLKDEIFEHFVNLLSFLSGMSILINLTLK
jgi:uncharacterized protein